MSKQKFHTIQVFIYMVAIMLDSLGVALMLKTSFGATPFGYFIANMALVVPLSIGLISFVYEVVFVAISAKVNRSRFKWELLIYSAVFAIALELNLLWLPDFGSQSWVTKVLITLLAVIFLDLSKALFGVTIFPRLSMVECFYALHHRYGWSLDHILKGYNMINLVGGLLFGLVAGLWWHQLGVGTVIAVLTSGYLYKKADKRIQKVYKQRVLKARI